MSTCAITSIHSRGGAPRGAPPGDILMLSGVFREKRLERLVEDLQPHDLGVAQVDDDAGALGRFEARLAQRVAQALRRPLLRLVPSLGCRLRLLTTPHDDPDVYIRYSVASSTARRWRGTPNPPY